MRKLKEDLQGWLHDNLGMWGIFLLCLYSLLVFAACIGLIIVVWQWPVPAGADDVTLPFLTGVEDPLMLLAALAGALGAFIHLATSLTSYIGNRRLFRSWVAWYVLRPFIGAALGFLGYFVLHAGLLADGGGDAINRYGVVALAGLFGMFSKQAVDKLREVFDTLMNGSKNDGRSDSLDDDRPPGSQ